MGGDIKILLILIILLLIIGIDIYKKIIPNELNILLLIIGIYSNYNFLEKALIGGAMYMFPFVLIYGYLSDYLKKEAIGYGDIKLVFSLGVYLKYNSLEEILIYLNIVFITATIMILILYLFKRKKIEEIPMAPFLILAGGVILWLRG